MFNSVFFLRLVDKLLILALPLLNLFPKKKFSSKKTILIVRLWGLGDSINVLPLIKQLNDQGFIVDVLTTKGFLSVFEKQDFIRNIYEFDYFNFRKIFSLIRELRSNSYSFVLDTEQFLNISTVLTVLSGSKKRFGFRLFPRSLFYTQTIVYSESKHFVENFISLGRLVSKQLKVPKKLISLPYETFILPKSVSKKIGIHMGSSVSAKARRWSPENFLDLINHLTNDNYDVFLIGTSEEKKIFDTISPRLKNKPKVHNLINRLSLKQFYGVCREFDLFIGNDSGPMHVAAAMGTKVIGLFGMNDPNKVGPWPLNKNKAIYKSEPGKKIINNQRGKIPSKKNSTINKISPSEVYKLVSELLK